MTQDNFWWLFMNKNISQVSSALRCFHATSN